MLVSLLHLRYCKVLVLIKLIKQFHLVWHQILLKGALAVVTAIASSGLAVSLTIPNTTSICSISGNTVTALAVGVCTVAADQAGSANFAAAPQQTQDITIGSAPASASALTIDVPLNTATTVNLAPFIVGSAITGVKLASLPTGGTATTNGTSITYVPKNNFFGTDSLSYVAFGATGESAPAVHYSQYYWAT